MADFVEYTLEDGTTVLFEAAEGGTLTSLHSGEPDVADGGQLSEKLKNVAKAAAEVARQVRETVTPDEISVEMGFKVGGELNWWFFAKNQAEASVTVTLTWKAPEQAP